MNKGGGREGEGERKEGGGGGRKEMIERERGGEGGMVKNTQLCQNERCQKVHIGMVYRYTMSSTSFFDKLYATQYFSCLCSFFYHRGKQHRHTLGSNDNDGDGKSEPIHTKAQKHTKFRVCAVYKSKRLLLIIENYGKVARNNGKRDPNDVWHLSKTTTTKIFL